MGILPNARQVRKQTAEEDCFDMKAPDEFLRRCRLNFSDHRAQLKQLTGQQYQDATAAINKTNK